MKQNGLKSSLTAQRDLSLTTIPQVRLTLLIPGQTETKVSMSTSVAQEHLPSLEWSLERSRYTQEVLGSPESLQGHPGPSHDIKRTLRPSPSPPSVLNPAMYIKGTPGSSIP